MSKKAATSPWPRGPASAGRSASATLQSMSQPRSKNKTYKWGSSSKWITVTFLDDKVAPNNFKSRTRAEVNGSEPMPSPFPGMDPYLERPSLWSDFHSTIIVAFRAALNAVLPERYVANVDQYVWLHEPDLETRRRLGRPGTLRY